MSSHALGEPAPLPPDLPPEGSTSERDLPREGLSLDSFPDAPPQGERWSTWDGAQHGPRPRPDWVVTEVRALDEDLGVLKTGKEADVHIVRRWVPDDPARDTLMAAKRFRSGDHRLFHRDAGYLEGRRMRRSRENRAMAGRTSFGKELIRTQWSTAEFAALGRLWELGLPVPTRCRSTTPNC